MLAAVITACAEVLAADELEPFVKSRKLISATRPGSIERIPGTEYTWLGRRVVRLIANAQIPATKEPIKGAALAMGS